MPTPSFQLLRPKILKSSLISPFISQLTSNKSIKFSTYLLRYIQNPTSYYPTTTIQATAISLLAWFMAVAPNRPLHCPLLGSSLNEPPKTQTGHSSAQNPLGAPPFLRAKASVLSVTGPARLGWLPATSLTCFLPFASLILSAPVAFPHQQDLCTCCFLCPEYSFISAWLIPSFHSGLYSKLSLVP